MKEEASTTEANSNLSNDKLRLELEKDQMQKEQQRQRKELEQKMKEVEDLFRKVDIIRWIESTGITIIHDYA